MLNRSRCTASTIWQRGILRRLCSSSAHRRQASSGPCATSSTRSRSGSMKPPSSTDCRPRERSWLILLLAVPGVMAAGAVLERVFNRSSPHQHGCEDAAGDGSELDWLARKLAVDWRRCRRRQSPRSFWSALPRALRCERPDHRRGKVAQRQLYEAAAGRAQTTHTRSQ